MRVKLAAGRKVRHPENPSAGHLTPEGTELEPVTVTPATAFFWAKLVQEGDAIVVDDDKPAE